MEHLWRVWTEYQTKKQSGVTFLKIKEKTLTIYENLKKKVENPAEVPSFSTSSDRFSGFKNHCDFYNVRLSGEAVSAEEAAKTFLPC